MKRFVLESKINLGKEGGQLESNTNYLFVRKFIAICLALVFFTTSCAQYELDAPQNQPIKNSDGLKKSTSNEGEVFIASIGYVAGFNYIYDSKEYDPFLFAETGEENYDDQTKLINRLIHFYDSLGYTTDKLLMNEIVEKIQHLSFEEAVLEGAQVEALNYAQQIRDMFENKSQSLLDFERDLHDWKETVINDPQISQLSSESLLFGYDMSISYLKHAEQNGAVLVGDLDFPTLFEMPCGVALVVYAAALISVCALTAGTAAVVVASTWVGFGGSVWGLFSSC